MESSKASATNHEGQQGIKSVATAAKPLFTETQVQFVSRILGTNNYWEILGVSKKAEVHEVEKAYELRYLEVHPSKNKAPGSLAAFQLLQKAFKQCLKIAQKRFVRMLRESNMTIDQYNDIQYDLIRDEEEELSREIDQAYGMCFDEFGYDSYDDITTEDYDDHVTSYDGKIDQCYDSDDY